MTRQTVVAACFLAGSLLAQSAVLVNEIQTGTTDWVEIVNLGPNAVNLSGYRLWVSATSGAPLAFVLPQGAVLTPGTALVVTDDFTGLQPAVGPGVQKFFAGGNIPWNTTGLGSTEGGACALTTPTNAGLDRVRWNTPADPLAFASPFAGTVAPTASGLARLSNTDSDSAVDWVSLQIGTATAGALNPGQSAPPATVSVIYVSPGPTAFHASITTAQPPMPNAEFIQLVSFQDAIPDGSGPLFGLLPDALATAFTPLVAGNPYHDRLDAAGTWAFDVAPGFLAQGLHFEGVVLVLGAGGIARVSAVASITL